MRLYFLALGTLMLVCLGCAGGGGHHALSHHQDEYVAPPAAMLAHPGPMVGGPGPGVMSVPMPPGGPGGGMQPVNYEYCPPGGGGYGYGQSAPRNTQVRFLGPEGMAVGWQIEHGFAENQLIAPARYNFGQGSTYRLKFANIEGREALTIYPSLHVYPVHPTTEAYLTHNAIPLRITDEDLDQVETNNFVTKVIYLPDAKFQDLAIAGVEELVSTRLGPGLDPISEADRRGTIMCVMRMGNLQLEMENGEGGLIDQTGYEVQQVDGMAGQHMAPLAIGDFRVGASGAGIPMDMMMGGPAGPGRPPYDPIVGVNGVPMYGMPHTGTPIGLAGPPHIPLGKPAVLQSHTMRNNTSFDVGEPVDHLLIDVKHTPGIRMPHPVKHIQYEENHPLHREGEVSSPAWQQ